jgi:hypothetical protein
MFFKTADIAEEQSGDNNSALEPYQTTFSFFSLYSIDYSRI